MMLTTWLLQHDLSVDVIEDLVAAIDADSLSRSLFPEAPDDRLLGDPLDLGTQRVGLTARVVVALSDSFGLEDNTCDKLANISLERLCCSGARLPHTVDVGPNELPAIFMDWHGAPADLICLAHETAHALHFLQSGPGLMPAIAREVCAFLGELSLIAHTKGKDQKLHTALCAVWLDENRKYFGSDLETLRAALRDPEAPYRYVWNYPVARILALHIFTNWSQPEMAALFKSGPSAMARLKGSFEDLASRAGERRNYLPVIPPRDLERPAVDMFRGLGAMALLDTDSWEGESACSIESYHGAHIAALRTGHAFIAMNDRRKPIGYVTWEGEDGTFRLTRQVAPFGDYLSLQQQLEDRLKLGKGVISRHDRSARPEQKAW